VGTTPPCEAPKTREQVSRLAADATVVVIAAVSNTATEIEDFGNSQVVGYPLSKVKILAGDSNTEVDSVAFNLAKGSEPMAAGDYLLFLSQALKVHPPRFYASYGIEGIFRVDGDQVFPVCVDWDSPGHPTIGTSSASLAEITGYLADVKLGSNL
jgi:hypothetical protein